MPLRLARGWRFGCVRAKVRGGSGCGFAAVRHSGDLSAFRRRIGVNRALVCVSCVTVVTRLRVDDDCAVIGPRIRRLVAQLRLVCVWAKNRLRFRYGFVDVRHSEDSYACWRRFGADRAADSPQCGTVATSPRVCEE